MCFVNMDDKTFFPLFGCSLKFFCVSLYMFECAYDCAKSFVVFIYINIYIQSVIALKK